VQIGAAVSRPTWGQGAGIGTVWSADTADGISALGVSPTPRNPPTYYLILRIPVIRRGRNLDGIRLRGGSHGSLTVLRTRPIEFMPRRQFKARAVFSSPVAAERDLRHETLHRAPSRAVGIRRAMPAIGSLSAPRVSSRFRPIGPTELRAGRGVAPPARIVTALLSATVSSRSPESENAPILRHFRA
jgi:hypothetical protein